MHDKKWKVEEKHSKHERKTQTIKISISFLRKDTKAGKIKDRENQ